MDNLTAHTTAAGANALAVDDRAQLSAVDRAGRSTCLPNPGGPWC